MTTPTIALLREPFPASQIGTIPKGGTKLEYVGHAAVTDRLLSVDPMWTWEPVAFDEAGAPLIGQRGQDAVMWIRLSVCGVTRFGVGIVPSKSFELEKQLISDAIRNAAMRFGVALDLWSKEDLHAVQDAEVGQAAGKRESGGPKAPPLAAPSATSPAVEAGEHPAAASPEPSSSLGAPGSSSGAASESPPSDAVPASPNKAQEIKARVSALLAAGQSVSRERGKWNLPLVDDCDAHQLDLFDEMLTEMERELVGAKS